MGGGGKSGSQTVGYRYYMGVQLVACHAECDAVLEFMFGERTAWKGEVTANASWVIFQPELFGGDKREGGVAGTVDACFGRADQGRNSYLAQRQGANCPAYRGVMSFVFRGFQGARIGTKVSIDYVGGIIDTGTSGGGTGVMDDGILGQAIFGGNKKDPIVVGGPGYSFLWTSGSPYFKKPWVRLRRILKGWKNDAPWYSAKARIGDFDMNPAHIIYQCLTDDEWGMGYNSDDIDDPSFRAAADKLSTENFGLSLEWTDQSSVEDFVQEIVNHINGSLRLSLKGANAGKFVLTLIRDDYDVNTLLDLNPSNILSLASFQRAAWGDTANEIVVSYTGRDEEPKTLAVQDLAGISAQGGAVVSVTKTYRGIREDKLAARVGMRDLATASSPLAKVVLAVNRVAYDKEVSDVIKLTWPPLGIANAPFRIVKINKGDMLEGRIEIEAVEDVFGLPSAVYTSGGNNGWQDPMGPPANISYGRVMELPYWEVARNTSDSDKTNLEPGYGFGQFLAVRPITTYASGFSLVNAPLTNGLYSPVATGPFCGKALLDGAIDDKVLSINYIAMVGQSDLTENWLPESYAYIVDADGTLEAVGVVQVNTNTRVATVKRGVLDTTPKPHASGAVLLFAHNGSVDQTQRLSGETTYYRALPYSGGGTLQVDSATTYPLTFNRRAERPYPPGNINVNGEYRPVEGFGRLVVTWSHRDRLQQTATLIGNEQGNIGPEAGTTYTIRYYMNNVLIETHSGLTGTTDNYAFSEDGTARIEIESVRDGLTSWQKQSLSLTYTRTEPRETEETERRVTELGVPRIVDASGADGETFNPADLVTGVTLSNGNRTMTRTSGNNSAGWARSINSRSSGKYYVEFKIDVVASGQVAIGLARSTHTTAQWLGQSANSWAMWNFPTSSPQLRKFTNNVAGTLAGSAALADGILGMAVDLDNGRVWWSVNGTWVEGNPSAGTGASYTGVTGALFLTGDCYNTNGKLTLRAPSEHSYTPPTGFTPGW